MQTLDGTEAKISYELFEAYFLLSLSMLGSYTSKRRLYKQKAKMI